MILTANQKRKLRHLWKGDSTDEEIREEMEFSEHELGEAIRLLELPERDEPTCYIPTIEEIRLQTAIIRSQWTQAERDERIRSAWGSKMEVDEEGSNAGRNKLRNDKKRSSSRTKKRRDRR